MKPRPDRRRKEPYYKVQHRDPVSLVWKDHRKEVFATLREAVSYIREQMSPASQFRVVEFNAGTTSVVHKQP